MAKKQTSSINHPIRRIVTVGIIGSLLVLIASLSVHISTLNSQVATLEADTTELAAELAARDALRCESNAVITQPDTTTRYSLESGGLTRTYQVHTPLSYDVSARYPVVISFDGIEGDGDRMESYSNLNALPALVVYPDSLPGKEGFTAWQGAPYSADGNRDIQFIRDLIETIPRKYCTDSTRTFAVGMSNGGSFASLVGCKLGDQIRAVASVSGANYTTCEQEERTPSLLVIHSTSDQQIPFAGSASRGLPELSDWAKGQASERRCAASLPQMTQDGVTTSTWLNCIDNAIVRIVVVNNQPHGWLQVPSRFGVTNTAEYIWQFFEDAMYYNE